MNEQYNDACYGVAWRRLSKALAERELTLEFSEGVTFLRGYGGSWEYFNPTYGELTTYDVTRLTDIAIEWGSKWRDEAKRKTEPAAEIKGGE